MEMNEWFSAGFFAHNLLVKRGIDPSFIQLGELIKKIGQAPFAERKSPSQFVPIAVSAATAASIEPSRVTVADGPAGSQSMTDHMQLLQLLLKKQQQQQQPPPPAVVAPNIQQLSQQQQLIQLLLQPPQPMRQQQAQQQVPFQLATLHHQLPTSTAGVIQSQQQMLSGNQQGMLTTAAIAPVRPRAIKSQQSLQLSDAGLLQQQRETSSKVDAAMAKLVEFCQPASVAMLTPEQKAVFQMMKQQQQLTSNVGRPLSHGISSFHRSVSQPVDMDLS
jgi:hypothetical protein